MGKHCTPQSIPNVTLSFILGLLFRKIPGFEFGEEFVLNNVSDIKGMRSTISFFSKTDLIPISYKAKSIIFTRV